MLGGIATAGPAAAEEHTSILAVTVGAHVITGIPRSVPAGQYVVIVKASGGNSLELARLRDGYTAAELDRDLAAGFSGGDLTAIQRVYDNVVFQAGTAGMANQQFNTYLEPGSYIYLNTNTVDPVTPFQVTKQGRTEPNPAEVGVTVTGFEDPMHPGHFGFDVSGRLARSGQLRFKAAGTDEPHFLAISKLAAGKTAMDCLNYQGPHGPGAPCAEVFSTGILSPGQAMVQPYELAGPGRYLLACFLPDPGHGGQPHVMLGMMKVIEVR